MIDIKSRPEDAMFRMRITDCGRYEIGIHPVLYGFRIRAGVRESQWCDIDYCCRQDLSLLNLAYNCVQTIMQERALKNESVFENFPIPENKFYNDTLAISSLIKMMTECGPCEPVKITLEELQSYREEMFQNLGISGE